MSVTITKYSDAFYERLVDFNKKVFPNRRDIEIALNFKIFENPFSKSNPDFFIALDEDKIIGQYLLISSKYSYGNKNFKIFWGCDYFVDELYRGSGAGLFLAQETLAKFKHIGMGSTPVAKKIHLALKENSIGYLYQFVYFRNLITPFYLQLKKLYNVNLIKEKHPLFPDKISVDNKVFNRLTSVPENYPEYWNEEFFEMTRSKEFLQWRFFSKHFHYYFYQLENPIDLPVYFVIRNIYRNGLNFLYLIDFRISVQNKQDILLIIKALKKLMKKIGMDAILCTSSIKIFDSLLKRNRFFHLVSKSTEVLTNVLDKQEIEKIKNREFFIITPADSDFDLLL